MNNTNEMIVEFNSIAQNEGFARMVVAAFIIGTNPTLEEVSDVKTAVSEAVTNSIIHGYIYDEKTKAVSLDNDGMKKAEKYDYQIVNDTVENAVEALEKILIPNSN